MDSFLSPDNQVVHAKILQALHVVEANQSFASTNGDSERFKHIFLDSEIPATYAQHASIASYVIVYGLAPHAKAALYQLHKRYFLLLQI